MTGYALLTTFMLCKNNSATQTHMYAFDTVDIKLLTNIIKYKIMVGGLSLYFRPSMNNDQITGYVV